MLFPLAKYEIEIRCHFSSDAEAYRVLPFLKGSLKRTYSWFDKYYGRQVFEAGGVLRASGVCDEGVNHYFAGWKGPDRGSLANLRREYNEEITGGIRDSAILRYFGKRKGFYKPPEIGPLLEQAGYPMFMTYRGDSLTGRDETLGVNTKLMHCAALKWPIMVELEKIADSRPQALACQRELESISLRFGLADRLVKEEPGTLLYQSINQAAD